MTEQQWDLGELDALIRQLDAVVQETAACKSAAPGVLTSVQMYGILPSPLVVPAMALVQSGMDEVLAELTETITSVRDAMKATREANAETEETNTRAGRDLKTAVEAQ